MFIGNYDIFEIIIECPIIGIIIIRSMEKYKLKILVNIKAAN